MINSCEEYGMKMMEERKSKWQPKPPRVQGGFLDIYRRLVSGADEGAVLR